MRRLSLLSRVLLQTIYTKGRNHDFHRAIHGLLVEANPEKSCLYFPESCALGISAEEQLTLTFHHQVSDVQLSHTCNSNSKFSLGSILSSLLFSAFGNDLCISPILHSLQIRLPQVEVSNVFCSLTEFCPRHSGLGPLLYM